MSAISVIVPVYKVEKYIHRCVDSILGQTFSDFELILVDDGSPDSCGAICDEYAAKNSRVVVIHQQNGGLSAARNAGIDWVFANSDSQWLTFVDSDDWIHPEYLQRLLNAAVDYNVSVSICGYEQTDGTEPDIALDMLTPVLCDTEAFYVEHNVNATVAWGKLYRKECFHEIRYPVGKFHEDEYVTHRILFALGHLAFVDIPLYAYFQNSSGITKSPWNPKRLDAISAIAEQMHYMKENDCINGYRYAAEKYVCFLCYHLYDLQKCAPEIQKEHSPKLRTLLRKALLMHRRHIPLRGNEWQYELAFPWTMRFYWFIIAQIRKLLP